MAQPEISLHKIKEDWNTWNNLWAALFNSTKQGDKLLGGENMIRVRKNYDVRGYKVKFGDGIEVSAIFWGLHLPKIFIAISASDD